MEIPPPSTIDQNLSRLSALIEAAYNEYADAIFRHCYFRLMQRERAKELMQETFLRVFEYVKKGSTVENMRAFLYRIANNLIVDDVRKRKEMSLDALQEEGFDPKGEDGTEYAVKFDHEQLLGILQRIEKDDRELIVMRYVDNLRPKDIAEMLNLSSNVVSVRLHRAMKQLEDILDNL